MNATGGISDVYVPQHLRMRVDRELDAGERVLWIGVPEPSLFTASSLAACFFAVTFTALSLLFMIVVGRLESVTLADGLQLRDVYPLFGLPFLVVGLLLFSKPWIDYKRAQSTVYAITDRRALLMEGFLTLTIRSFSSEEIGDVYRRERRNGRGDVVIRSGQWVDSDGYAHVTEYGFLCVRNPREVERLLKDLASRVTTPIA